MLRNWLRFIVLSCFFPIVHVFTLQPNTGQLEVHLGGPTTPVEKGRPRAQDQRENRQNFFHDCIERFRRLEKSIETQAGRPGRALGSESDMDEYRVI